MRNKLLNLSFNFTQVIDHIQNDKIRKDEIWRNQRVRGKFTWVKGNVRNTSFRYSVANTDFVDLILNLFGFEGLEQIRIFED